MVANSLAKSRGFDRVELAEAIQYADVEVDPLKEQDMKRARELGVLAMVFAFGSLGIADDPVRTDDPAKGVEEGVEEAAKDDETPAEAPKEPSARSTWEYLSEKYDADSDGKITPEEYGRDETHFKRLDIDGDGFIGKAEIEERDRSSRGGRGGRGGGRGAGGGRGGRRGSQGERPERGVAPLEGSEAPDFELLILAERRGKAKKETKEEEEKAETETEGEEEVESPKKLKLSSFKAKRPVALIFGSYT